MYKGEAPAGGRSCISVTSRLINLKLSGNATFLYLFHFTEKDFFFKSTLRLSYRYATFSRPRSPKGEAEILMLI